MMFSCNKNRTIGYLLCLLVGLLVLLVVGCAHRNGGDHTTPSDGLTEITLSTFGGVQVARAKGALTEEAQNDVKTACVVIFDKRNNEAVIEFANKIEAIDNGNKVFRVALPRSETPDHHYDLLVLANSPLTRAELEAQCDSINQKGIKLKEAWIQFQRVAIKTPTGGVDTTAQCLPMCGWVEEIELPETQENNIVVSMVRSVAGIDVGENYNALTKTWEGLDNFEFTNVYLYNANYSYLLLPNPANLTGDVANKPSVSNLLENPPSPTPQSFFTVPSGSKALVNVVYMAEVHHENLPSREQTAVVVGGYYNGSTTLCYYRMNFRVANLQSDLLRNHKYVFNISKVSGAGYPTPDEAFASETMHIEYDVKPWSMKEYILAVPESSYALSVSQTKVVFDHFGGDQEVDIVATAGRPYVHEHWDSTGGGTNLVHFFRQKLQPDDPDGEFTFTLRDLGANKYRLTVSCLPSPTTQIDTVRDRASFRAHNLFSYIDFARTPYDENVFYTIPASDTVVNFGANGQSFPIVIKSSSQWGLKLDSEHLNMVEGIYGVDADGKLDPSKRIVLTDGYYLPMGDREPITKYWIRFNDLPVNFMGERIVTVRFVTDLGDRRYKLVYAQGAPMIRFLPNTVLLPKDVTTGYEFYLQTNRDWQLALDRSDFVQIKNGTSGIYDKRVVVDVSASDIFAERQTVITASGTGAGMATFTLRQERQTPTLSVSPSSATFVVSRNGGTSSVFAIESNASWRVYNAPSGATVNGSTGTKNGTFTVTLAANAANALPRLVELAIEPTDATITQVEKDALRTHVTVLQEAGAVISMTSAHVAYNGGRATLEITSNAPWEIQNTAGLVPSQRTGGAGTTQVRFNLGNNVGTSARTYTILVETSTTRPAAAAATIQQPTWPYSYHPAGFIVARANSGQISGRDAFNYCDNLREDGYATWKVPFHADLKAMWSNSPESNNLMVYNGEDILPRVYWGLEWRQPGKKWYHNFANGHYDTTNDTDKNFIRCIRDR